MIKKTTTKQKAASKKNLLTDYMGNTFDVKTKEQVSPKVKKTTSAAKRGRPVGSTKAKALDKAIETHNKKFFEEITLGGGSGDGNIRDSKGNIIDVEKHNKEVLNIPTREELGMQRGNNEMSLVNKITLVLALVNVAILMTLILSH